MFPNLGEVALYKRCPLGPSSTFPLVTRALCSRSAPYVGCMGPSTVVGPTAEGTLVGRAGPWPGWLPGTSLCHGCRAADGEDWVPEQLAAWSGGSQGWC